LAIASRRLPINASRLTPGPRPLASDRTSLREAADHMVQQKIGRLPVVTRADPRRPVGILTRSDLLEAHERRIDASTRSVRSLVILPVRWRGQA
jgi:CBS-domain-containing membrane protein